MQNILHYSAKTCQAQSCKQLKGLHHSFLHLGKNGCMKPNASKTLQDNIKMLMSKTKTNAAWIATRSGVSQRMVDYIAKGERVPTIEIVDKIAQCYGLTGWQLQMPSLPYDLAKSGTLEHLIDVFMHSDDETRNYTLKVMERDAEYNKSEDAEQAKQVPPAKKLPNSLEQ